MKKKFLLLVTLFLTASLNFTKSATVQAQSKVYNPISISTGNYEFSDRLSDRDIPTGEGGFARDYYIKLEEKERIAIKLTSDEFDTVVMLIGDDGTTIAENDDGPDGTTNSLLFFQIVENGKYIVRVVSFGETGGGKFNLKIDRLQTINQCGDCLPIKKNTR